MADQRIKQALASLYSMVDAGEKGYAVVAANCKNPGLKVLFKSMAGQRAGYRDEIEAEVKRLGMEIRPRTSFRGMVHRGRINIFATLIIENYERDMMVFGEILLGEKAARRLYEKILRQELPAETCAMLEHQYQGVCAAIEQVQLLRGRDGRRQVISLYDSEKDVEKITSSLRQAGLPAEAVERVTLGDFANLYLSKGRPVQDAIISGAAGGSLWGSVIGSLAGLGAMQSIVPDGAVTITPQTVWALVALAGIAGGGLIGSILGFFIGLGVSEEDNYQYAHSMEHGHTIIKVTIDESRRKEVGLILSRAHLEPLSSG